MLAKTKHNVNTETNNADIGRLSRATVAKRERLECANDPECAARVHAAPSWMSRRAERARMSRISDIGGWRLSTW